MKKLFVFILASLFCLGLFAEGPKIPKVATIDESKYLTYMNDSGTNLYSTISVVNKAENNYLFSINNQSYITDTYISVTLTFNNEKTLDNFIKKINTLDLENEFSRIRNIFIKYELPPEIIYSDNNSKISMLLYQSPFYPEFNY